jgi:Kef-type K+ transport system membrane component KefB
LETFTAASHDEVLQLVVQIAVLLASARLLGGLSQRLGQPAVVGEILAGVILGPSLLSGLFPVIGEWVLPQTQVQGHMLEVVALIGVMFLLVVTGLETDLGLIRRRIGVASGVAVGGLVVPFASGLALGFLLPDSLLVDPGQRTVFALFVATALSISAIPVLAKILMDLDLMRREFGQTVLAAGMIDDITGWTLLGLVSGLAAAEALTAATVAITIGKVALFVVVTAVVGRHLVDRSLVFVQERSRGSDPLLTLLVVLAFAWGAFSQAMGLEPVIGAFAIGILFGRLARLPSEVGQKVESMSSSVFAPIFFAVAGLKVNIFSILHPDLLAITLLVILVGIFGKVVGAYGGARWLSRQDHWSALAYGSGLNARGAVGIIVATIGHSLGILSAEMLSMIVVMAVVTSLIAPSALRYCLARVEPGAEEQQRLAKEDALKGSFTAGIRRILLPLRPQTEVSATQRIQATIVSRIAQAHEVSTTLFSVSAPGDRAAATAYFGRLRDVFGTTGTTTRIVGGDNPVEAILAQAGAGYDLMVIGAPSVTGSDANLFGPMIDDLIRLAPCPTLVVRGMDVAPEWEPRRILVPVSGSYTARNAADLAIAIAGSDAAVTGVHIVESTPRSAIRRSLALDVTAELEEVATQLGQELNTEVREATDVESGILAAVEETGADLLVLGTSVRAGTTHLHLGPRVEFLLRSAPCSVIVLNT